MKRYPLRAITALRERQFARAIFAASLAVLLLAPVPAARALDADEVQVHELPNGMTVLLWPDDTIPNLAIYTFWHVGSRNEAPGITGLAHFFEHMMFNGSRNYPPGAFDTTMEASGGANNAYTSRDVTVYQNWVPADALELTLDLERDRIGWLSVDPELVESERGVVMSERRRSIEDDNHSLMWEQMYAAMYTAHPYQWPIIGWRSDIENWRQSDVEAFHRAWYTPNNATMVIVGAFDLNEIVEIIDRKLGDLPAREIPRDVVTLEPPQRGERRVELRKEASLGSVVAAWHVPETAHEDIPALELMDLILGQGESSRLYRRLVDQDQLALWTRSGLDNHFDAGSYEIMVQNRAGVDGAQIERALYEELARMADEAVSERELTKAKNILIAGFYRQMATIGGKADALGSYELFRGDWRKLFTAERDYESVTAEDIQRVARQYLRAENRTVVTLIPTSAEGDSDES